MKKEEKNTSERKCEVTFEEIDEVFDMMACGGLDPNPRNFRLDYPGLKRYAESVGKRIDELTADETEPFFSDIED